MLNGKAISIFYSFVALSSLQANSQLDDFDSDSFWNELSAPSKSQPQKAEPIASRSDTMPMYNQPASTEMDMDKNYPGRGKENMVYAGNMTAPNGVHFDVFGEFIYWDSGINQVMNYQYFNQAYNADDNVIRLLRVLYTNKTKFDPGFRVGIKQSFATQGWDLGANWTWYQNKKSKSWQLSDIQPRWFNPIWENYDTTRWPQSLPNTTQVNTWKMLYNQVDITLGKEIFFSKYFSLRPSMGGRYVNCNSGFTVNIDDYSDAFFYQLYNHISMNNRLSIWGFIFGLDTKFMLGCGFSVAGTLNAGLAYGRNQVSYKSHWLQHLISDNSKVIIGSKNSMTARDLIPLIDARMDLAWERAFFGGKQAISISVGYDYKALLSAFTTMAFPAVLDFDSDSQFEATYDELATIQHTNLFLQGLNVGIKYSF